MANSPASTVLPDKFPKRGPNFFHSITWDLMPLLGRSQYATSAIGPRELYARTVPELIEAGVPVGIHDAVMYYVLLADRSATPGSDPLPALVDCSKEPTSLDVCLERLMASRGRFALMINEAKLLTSVPARHRERLHRLATPFVSTPVVVFFSRDFPLADVFSRYAASRWMPPLRRTGRPRGQLAK